MAHEAVHARQPSASILKSRFEHAGGVSAVRCYTRSRPHRSYSPSPSGPTRWIRSSVSITVYTTAESRSNARTARPSSNMPGLTGNRPISEPREYALRPEGELPETKGDDEKGGSSAARTSGRGSHGQSHAVMSSRVTVSGSSLADVGALLAHCVVGESGAAPARHAVVDPIAGEIEASMRRCQRGTENLGCDDSVMQPGAVPQPLTAKPGQSIYFRTTGSTIVDMGGEDPPEKAGHLHRHPRQHGSGQALAARSPILAIRLDQRTRCSSRSRPVEPSSTGAARRPGTRRGRPPR
jgi:hypothetical protein